MATTTDKDLEVNSQVDLDEPPPYELHSSGQFLSTTATIALDGTLTVELSSPKASELRALLPAATPAQPISATALTGPCPHLNIVIHVVGSRGDVQPFIAYGAALRQYGHRVRLATHGCFSQFVRESGLEFYSIGGDPAELMAYMVKNPGLMPSLESLRGGDIGRKRRMIHEMLRGCWASCIESDLDTNRPFVADAIIANPPSFAHVHCAQALGIPAHIMFTMPWNATRAFPHPLVKMNSTDIEPGIANWLTYGLVELMTWQGLGDVINHWRQQQLELDKLSNSMGPSVTTYLRIPHTYCWSPALVPKPTDWGSEIDVCGFFMRDEPSYTPPPDLESFLAQGPAPIYVGFGSIVLDDPERLYSVILDAAKRCRVRVVVSRGWSRLGGNACDTADVFHLGDCPHEWLFKRVSAVVHHGGAGTTACGLVNARPTLIVPFFGDQPFWGSVVAAARAGPNPIPQKELQVDNLTDAIRYITSAAAYHAASILAAQMRHESGVNAAVQSFHQNLPLAALTCDLVPEKVARWSMMKHGRTVKLSDAAVAVLVAQKRIQIGQAKPLRVREYDTDVRRWDPLSGGAASTLGTVTDFGLSLGGLFVDPYKEYKRAAAGGRSGSSTTAAARAAGSSAGAMTGALTKGMLVDMPLALAEGMKNVPRLYGEEVPDHGKVKDWQSGGKVAVKTFTSGFYHGITGVAMQPWEGAKKEGFKGFLKGAGKGTIGLVTKPGAALFGLVGYPALGIAKSLAHKRGVEKSILAAKWEQVDFCASRASDQDTAQITAQFDSLLS